MVLVTLTSDLGLRDNYVALVKAAILKRVPEAQIIDISHETERFNAIRAAYLFEHAFRAFPENSWHLVGLKSNLEAERLLFVRMDNQNVICPDNGFITLIEGYEQAKIFVLDPNLYPFKLFAMKSAMVDAFDFLVQPGNLERQLKMVICEDFQVLTRMLPVINSNSLVGSCIYVDDFGNVVTNITTEIFEKAGKGRKFKIQLPGTAVFQIRKDYPEAQDTDALAIFNSFGHLEIAINRSKAIKMLFPNDMQYRGNFNVTVDFLA